MQQKIRTYIEIKTGKKVKIPDNITPDKTIYKKALTKAEKEQNNGK